MNDALTLVAVALAGVAALAAIVAALRSGRAPSGDDGTVRLATMLQGLVAQSNLDREAIQQALAGGAKETQERIASVGERLVVIDAAQKQIEELKSQVVDLVAILGSNQSRGAFGEVRLEQIVEDVLPADLYEFQATLSNRSRVDCLIRFGEKGGDLAVDSKFPLESYRALLAATDDTTRQGAERQFKVDVKKHVDDISSKYLVKGETRDLALMFIPAESIYGELMEHYSELIDYASKRRVYFTSPNTLHGWLTNLKSVYIDARIAEQARLIQTEVGKLLDDVGRLDGRVEALEDHFAKAQKDVDEIRTSTKKIVRGGERIRNAEIGDGEAPPPGIGG